jgi:hypothetical protein
MRILFAGRLIFLREKNCEPKVSGKAGQEPNSCNPHPRAVENFVEELSIIIKGVSPRKNKQISCKVTG